MQPERVRADGRQLSFESPREQASAEAARTQSTYATKLSDVALPQLKDVLGRVTGDLSATGIAPSVQGAFDTARTGLNKDFDIAGRGNAAYLKQAFAQSGNIYSTNQVNDAEVLQAHNLDIQRRDAMRRLDFQEASAGLGQYNTLMNLLGVGSGAALNLGQGFSTAQAQAIQGLSNVSQGQSTVSGALAGASLGTSIYPGWGTLIGGALGAAGGALSYGG